MSSRPQPSKGKIIQALVVALLFVFLLAPNIYAVCVATDLTYSIFKQAGYFFVVVLCLLLSALIFKRKVYFLLEGIFTLLLAPIETASLYLNRMPVSPLFMRVITNTNIREASELLVSSIPLVIAIISLWALYFFLVFRLLDNTWLLSRRVRHVICCAIPIALVSGMAFSYHTQKTTNSDRGLKSVVRLSAQTLTMKFNKIFPYDIYISLHNISAERREIRRQSEQIGNFSFGIEQKNDSVPEVYVLVIGEAARAANFSLNGYARKTSPLLDAEENVVSFACAFSSANVTEVSVPMMLTRATNDNSKSAYSEKSVVEAFQEAGFSTAWLTSKTPFAFTSRIIETTDSRFVNSRGTDAADNYDMLLTDKLHTVLDTTTAKKLFIVIHHTGSHFKYSQRYPDEFEVFRPALGKDAGYNTITKNNREILVNAYDNSILYTDWCLSHIIELLRARHCPAALVYMSDHGENLYDDGGDLVLHCTYSGSRYEFNVPFVVWYSDEYGRQEPQKTKELHLNSTKLVSSDALFHSLLDMASIPTPCLDSSLSVFETAYIEPDSVSCITASGKRIFFGRDD